MNRQRCFSTDVRAIVRKALWLPLLASVLVLSTARVEAANTLGTGTGGGGAFILGIVLGPGGTPLANASVEACPESGAFPCATVATVAGGQYSIPIQNSDTYDLTARPPQTGPSSGLVPVQFNGVPIDASACGGGPTLAAVGTCTATHDFQLGDPNAPPPNALLVPFRGFDSSIPVIYYLDALTLVAGGCPNGQGFFEVLQGGQVIRGGGMTESPPGSGRYNSSVAPFFPTHGYATVIVTIDHCHHPADDAIEGFDIYIDPSGTVKTSTGDPIPGATVTLFRSDSDAGPFTPVPDGSTLMSIANRTNPMLTDGAGHFGWDVVKGFYKVRAEKNGCGLFVESPVLTIPPPVIDLALVLDATTSDCTRTLDHFLCYKAAPASAHKGSPPFPAFTPTPVAVTDQFGGPLQYDLTKDIELCNPANKNDEDLSAPGHLPHLEGYQAKLVAHQPKFLKSIHTVLNQFGTLKLSLTAPDRLFVPTAKALGEGGAPPLTQTIDHLMCYKASVAKAPKGQPPFPIFTPKTVRLTDQFGGPLLYDLKKPTRLCAPAEKNDEDPTAPLHATHLVCYKATLSKTHPAQPKFSKTRVSTNNQFGPEVLDVTAVQELCVPSAKLD